MALFSRKTESSEAPATTTTAETPTPPAAGAQIDYDKIISGVTENLRGIVQPQQQQQQQPQVDDGDNDFADMTPEERRRAERIADRAAQNAVAPYANIFAGSIPQLARDNAVAQLTEGQQMMYKKYQKEVDEYVSFATKTQPAMAGDPRIHTRAIKLMLGEHADEIERLAFQHMKEEDVPPQFARPSANSTDKTNTVELTPFEQNSLEYYQTRKNNLTKKWTPEDYKYYKNLKPGYMHEMVAEHKERTKKD
jgi:hypothetical protein